jgi:Fibronectin type III domain
MAVADWLPLLLLVPAIIVPVIVLAGFAACDRVFGLQSFPVPPPVIDSVTGKDDTTVTLTWHWSETAQKYQFERTDPDGNVADFDVPAPATSFDDTNLAPGTIFRYRVRGYDTSGEPTDWSAPVSGATLASAYAKTLTANSVNWQGYTLVQRIEAAQLAATGPHVRISLQAGSARGASIDRMSISQVASAGKPYDSAPDLTLVYDLAANQQQPFVVPAGMIVALPIVAYTLNRFQGLLIAVDFSAAPPSDVATTPVPTSEATAYYFQTSTGEAAVQTRSPNYQQAGANPTTSGVFLITDIEVG